MKTHGSPESKKYRVRHVTSLYGVKSVYITENCYGMRFGVVHCDFKTQKRTPKLSALWYKKVVKGNRFV